MAKKHLKKCSMFLVIMEMQLKKLWDSILLPSEWLRYKTQDITHVPNDVEQGEHIFIAGGNANLYNHFVNKFGIFSENLE